MNIRLRPKLLALFLLSSLLPLVLTGWMTARWLGEAANEAARTRAATLIEVKKNRLEQTLARYRADMETLTNSTQTLYTQQAHQLETVRDSYGKAVQHQFQEWTHEMETLAATEQLAKNLASIDWVFRDGGEKITGERWPVLSATMTPALNRFREKQGFDNLYLVSAQGNVVLSALPDPLLGKNGGKSPLKESGFGKLLAAALTKSSFQGFAPAPYLDRGLTAWIGTPVRKDGDRDGRIIGILAARISPDPLAKLPLTRDEATKTIHLTLVGPDHRPYAEFGQQPTDAKPAKGGEMTTPAVMAALANQKGVGALKGLNGQGVFSAWAPITIAPVANSPEPPWAVVAEQAIAQTFLAGAGPGVPFYKKQMDQSGYYDFFLIQPDGEVFYSAARQADFGTNLLHGKYADTNLGKLVQQVVAKHAFGLTDFAPYPPSNNEPAAFMAQPVMQDGTLTMVVALQLPMEALTTLMQHRDGLESDGDAYLVGPDGRMRSDSIRDPQNHSVLASFAGKMADNDLHSEAIQSALAGQSGLILGQNWSGRPVFTAFAPLSLGNETTWALIIETPMIQGMLPLHAFPRPIWLVAAIALLGSLGIAWMTATTLRRTLFRCVEPLQEMQKGHFSSPPLGTRTDEFGMVAREIQGIAGRWHQVATRLRDSGTQVAQTGRQLSGLARHALDTPLPDQERADLEAGEWATREIATRIQHHLRQIQTLEQLLGRVNQTILQGRQTMEQAMASAKEIADKVLLFADTAQQINQLSMKAAFEVSAASDGKGIKRSGSVIMEIRQLAENGRIFADEIGELSLGTTLRVDNAHTLLEGTAATLQESATLMQGMVQADTAQHGQMVHIHDMTQVLKRRLQHHDEILQQLTPVAQALVQQVVLLQRDLAFFNQGTETANQTGTSEEEMIENDLLALQEEDGNGPL